MPLLDEVLPQFASRLIRNGATLGGNLGTGSPIGDLPPALLALEASVVLASPTGEREVPLADYFTGYRETVRRPGELITGSVVPLPAAPLAAFHKIAKRRFDDISSVAVAFALDVVDGDGRAGRGSGSAASPPRRSGRWRPRRRWRAGRGRRDRRGRGRGAAGEGTPIDDHRASAAYRAAMLGKSLRKLWAESPRGRRR